MEAYACTTCTNNLCVGKVSVFNQLSYADMLEVAKMTGHKDYKKGEYLCHEGDKLSTLFIVNQGKVKLSKFNKQGKEQILNILSDGEIFAEYYLFSDFEPYNFSAIALTDLKICTLSKKNMDYLFSKHPDISLKIMVELSKKLIKTEKLAQNLSTINTKSKVAYVLNELAKEHGIKLGEKVKLVIPLTREEMANYAGVTRETMSRKLGDFEKVGLIEAQGNKVIIINNLQALIDTI